MKKIYRLLTLFLVSTINAQDANLDSAFANNGVLILNNFGIPASMAFQPDGKILIYGYKIISTIYYPTLFRLNTDGTLDSSFGNSGIKTFTNYPGSNVGNFVVQNDGNLLVTIGSSLYRLNSIGVVDGTFNNNNGYTNDANFVKVLTDGKLIVVYEPGQQMQMRRLNANGTEDSSFNNGTPQDIYVGTWTRCTGVNELSNGKIVVTATNNNGSFTTVRFNANGSSDITYSTSGITNGGYLRQSKSVANDLFFTMVYGFSSVFSVLKYNALGNLDTTFDTDGVATTNFGTNEINVSYNVNVQADNKIIVIGKTGGFTTSSFGITRFNSDGSLDTSFGLLGKTTIPSNTLTDSKTFSALSPLDGKLTVIGQANTIPSNVFDVMIVRHNTGANLSNSDVQKNSKLTLYPNPTSSVLNIQTDQIIQSIALFDVLGRQTLVTDFSNNQIDVSTFSNGIYFIEVTTDSGLLKQKFIKQ